MGFLAPWGFLAALAPAAVLAVWLLRARHRDQEVATTYLWEQVLSDLRAGSPWRRLRRQLLMALQLLAAGALVLALARPYLPGALAPGGHLVLVVDVSGAMRATPGGGLPLLVRAREQALDLARGALALGRVSVVSAGAQPRTLVAGATSLAPVQGALDRLAPEFARADLPAALSLAQALGRDGAGVQVVVFTDRAPAAVAGAAPSGAGAWTGDTPGGAAPGKVTYVALGAPVQNLAVTDLAVAGGGAVVRVVNTGAVPLDFSLELRGDGRLLETRSGRLEPGRSADLTFPRLPGGLDSLEARLGAPDEQPADDAAWAPVGGPGRLRVLLVSPGNVFLERALALRPGVEVVRARPTDYSPGDYGLYAFDGWLPPALPPVPALVLDPPDNPWLPTGEEFAPARVEAAAGAAQLLADVPLAEVHVARARRLREPGWSRRVLEAPEGALLLAGERDGVRTAVFAFDLHESDLPLRVAFPVLVQNLLHWLAPPAPVAATARAGDRLPLALDPLAEGAEVITPSGRRLPLALPAAPFADTGELGLYRLVVRRGDGEASYPFAVNAPPPADEVGAGGFGPGAPGEGTGPGAPGAPDRAAGPRELWPLAVLAALGLLAAEWWVYSRGG